MTEPQPFWKVPPAGFRDVLETKATGTFLVAREVVPRMLNAGGVTATGIIPDDVGDELRGKLLDPAIMGRPIVWLLLRLPSQCTTSGSSPSTSTSGWERARRATVSRCRALASAERWISIENGG